MRKKEIIESLKEVSRNVNDWSGRTRNGDGLDRGSLEELKREISRLQRICNKLIWLNPVLGYKGYEPLTRGMQTALPHIDEFLPAHNLANLEDLASLLTISQE